MKLKCLGSGSSGNCYLLESDSECLVIEAGLPFMEVKKALNFNIKKIVGVISTHVHNDHFKYFNQFKKAGIQSTCFGKEIPEYESEKREYYAVGMGEFRIKPFPNMDKDGKWLHNNSDGSECPCYGFYITHPGIGIIVYASDTEYIRWRFKNVNHILIEANYSMDFVDKDKPNYAHVLQGHMSIDTARKFLEVNKSPQLRNVILCHLSEENASAEEFTMKTKKVVNCPVCVARKGLEVDLNLVPF